MEEMEVNYWIPGQGESEEDATYIECDLSLGIKRGLDYEIAAESCAENYFYYQHGWESDWPLEIMVKVGDNEPKLFLVEVEQTPVFSATERKNYGKKN